MRSVQEHNSSVASLVYSIKCEPLIDMDVLRSEWVSLEEKADNQFFLSWSWVGTWLHTYKPVADIMRAYCDGELVGLAVLVKSTESRFGLLKSTALHLHQTGEPKEDQIWIEYNGFLMDARHECEATKACLNFLITYYKGWDEMIVGAIAEQDAQLYTQISKLTRHELWEAPCYGVDLAAIRKEEKPYLQTISSNTRYQIRRSLKQYRQQGTLIIERVNDKSEAISFLNELAPSHKLRWGGGVGESGFANPKFIDFHKNLIDRSWSSGHIDGWRLLLDGVPLAYFYNFIYQNRVYFYLSGIEKNNKASLKPGLVGHSLCIQQYIEEGYEFYDFMGGGERYKKSLANKHQHLYKISLQKNRLIFKLKQVGRKIKHRLFES